MSLVRRNLVANIAGKSWAALMSLAVVPVYLHFLGIEAYGLIGIFLALIAILSLLDLGLGTTLNRELARLSVQSGSGQHMRDLLRTLEVAYWLIGLAIGIALAALAPVIAAHWVKAQQLSRQTVEHAFLIMGIAIACQWPLALYAGGLMGLQRQVMINAISAAMVTVRSVGAVVVLWQVSATIEAFLLWNLGVSLVETLVTGAALWRSLPAAAVVAGFKANLLLNVWRFAAGMTGISAMALVLTQLDKVILSKVLSLEAFGYYSLAWRVAAGLYYLVSPITTAFFPRFSQLAMLNDQQELARLYHRGCQLMSVLILPVAVVLALFSYEFLQLWTQNRSIAENSYLMLSLLVIGNALNGLMNLPLALQLAHGWTRLVFLANTVAVLVLAPLIYFMSLRYGGVGAAWVWLILNCGYVVFLLQMMHRKLLHGHLREWFVVDVGAPLAASLAVAGLWKQAVVLPGPWWMLFNLVTVSLLTTLAAAFAAPQIRALIVQRVLSKPHRKAGL